MKQKVKEHEIFRMGKKPIPRKLCFCLKETDKQRNRKEQMVKTEKNQKKIKLKNMKYSDWARSLSLFLSENNIQTKKQKGRDGERGKKIKKIKLKSMKYSDWARSWSCLNVCFCLKETNRQRNIQ